MHNLVKQVRSEVRDFLDETIPIASIPGEDGKVYQYNFSQRELNALIDFAWNSQFKTGPLDPQGMQKLYLNVGRFRTDVAEMQIDIDVANFLFVPTSDDYWTSWFMSKDFHQWVREYDYGETINDWGADLPRRGSAVSKKVGSDIERVDISRLMNTQSARSLKEAATSGGYVIQPMELTPKQVEAYPAWNLDNLDSTDEASVFYERYGLITEADIEMAKGKEVKHMDSENHFLGVSVVSVDVEKESKKGSGSGLLFAEEIAEDDFPYNEVHWARQDGRWQGVGVMEEQFSNQLAKHLTTYYRQKSMYWAGKRMYLRNWADGPNNLATEVKDGGVIDGGTGATLTAVNTQTQHLGDFQAMDNQIENIADQTSFTYEAASGDSPKAGTPYSLQVQVDNTLQKHFGKKKERFGAFLRRIFFDQQVDIFKKDKRKEHTLSFAHDDEGVELLREGMVAVHTADRWVDSRSGKHRPTMQEIEDGVRQELERSPFMVAELPDGHYDNAKVTTDVIITGERKNMYFEIETLKTLIADARAEGDLEGASKYKRELMSLTGRMPASQAPTKNVQPVQQAAPPQAPEQPVPINA